MQGTSGGGRSMGDAEKAGQDHGGRGPSAAEVRRARQKAALKANMARRKAQARALAAQDFGQDDPAGGPQDGTSNEKE